MTARTADLSPSTTARITGVLYLLIIVLGIFAEAGTRARVIVADDPGATAAMVAGSVGLLQLGFLADSIVFLCDAAVAVFLYVLLRPVHRTWAMVAAAFRMTQTAVLALNLLDQHAALLLLTGPEYAAIDTTTRDALAYLMLDRHAHGYDLGLLFFGVHCLIIGVLIARSAILPRALGWLLVGASVVYVAGSYVHFLAPAWSARIVPVYAIALVAEVGLCGWLLIRGVDAGRWRELDRPAS